MGLGNTGTWFIGRLQTDRDKARVIEGLLGAAPGDGAVLDAAELEKLLSSLGNRVFLMRNVHDDRPVLFETRWAMSYLRGPMTLPQIKDANGLRGAAASAPAAPVAEVSTAAPPPPPPVSAAAPVASPASAPAGAKPTLPPGVTEIFLRPKDTAAEPTWRARVLGQAKLHFVDAKCDLDVWQSVALVAPVSDDGTEALWSEAVSLGDAAGRLDRNPPGTGVFQALAAGLDRPRNYAAWEKMLASHLYQNVTLDLGVCPPLKLVSRPGESEGDFRVRVEVAQRGVRDQVKARLEAKYRPKLQTLQDRRRRAQERVEREQSQVSQQKMSTAISIGAGVLGALFGRKIASAGNVGRMATAMRSANRVGREQEDVARAGESVQAVQQQLDDLNAQFQAEVAQAEGASGGLPACERAQVRPRKSDVTIGAVSLVWTPWRASPDGAAESLF